MVTLEVPILSSLIGLGHSHFLDKKAKVFFFFILHMIFCGNEEKKKVFFFKVKTVYPLQSPCPAKINWLKKHKPFFNGKSS